MIQEDLSSWEELEDRLRQLNNERDERAKQRKPILVSSFLYRGHEDANWSLETSLERFAPRRWTFADYYRVIARARPQIETLTGHRWEIEDYPKLKQWWDDYENFHSELPAYDYLIYLRHHAFPSPLLDWTRSPYVAAYFAFAAPKADRVALYAYSEYPEGFKGGSSDAPEIKGLGQYVRSHERHFRQQSEYTLAGQFIDGRWTFVGHEDAFSKTDSGQDLLWKFTLPRTERRKVLKNLDAYNLNAYSLFQTEEAMLRTVAVREIELSDRD